MKHPFLLGAAFVLTACWGDADPPLDGLGGQSGSGTGGRDGTGGDARHSGGANFGGSHSGGTGTDGSDSGGETGLGGLGGGNSLDELEPFDCDAAPPGTCDFGDDFVMRWLVREGHEVQRLPLVESGSYDFVVDWGDGITGRVTSSSDPDAQHTFALGDEIY